MEQYRQDQESLRLDQEGTSQQHSKEIDDKGNFAPIDERPGISENVPHSLQKTGLKTQRQECIRTEDGCCEDGLVQRLPHLSQGLPLITEEELDQLAVIKVSQGKNMSNLIQKIQRQIKEEEVLKEFMSLEYLKPLDDCQVAKAPENREKNRYRDILPYDATRVPIGERYGYINANYIHMHVGTEDLFYISTQGPLLSTTNDFWQMVWEHHTNVIAMITREVESGITKCHRYWPDLPHCSLDLIQFHLQLLNYQFLDYFIIRIIQMIDKQTQKRRIVQHLQFTNWPDHSTPKSPAELVKFVRYMRKIHQSGPIITHCSAGVGRSGVLLCVDIILTCIEKDVYFEIKHIVISLRNQRSGMIQTKEQYMFCYETALEVLKNSQNKDSQLEQYRKDYTYPTY